MHGYRLSLLTTVVILAATSLGYADSFSWNVFVGSWDGVTASATYRPTKGKAFDLALTCTPNTPGAGATTCTYALPAGVDLTSGLVGPKEYAWTDQDETVTVVDLLSNGIIVTPDVEGYKTGTALDNWEVYSTVYNNSDGNWSGAFDLKVNDAWDVPEPNSLLLIGAGLLSVPWLRTRYRKRG